MLCSWITVKKTYKDIYKLNPAVAYLVPIGSYLKQMNWNWYVAYTPVTPNSFLLCSSERAQTVSELPEHSTNYLNAVQTTWTG